MGSGTSSRIKRAATAERREDDRAAWHRRAGELYEDLRRPAIGLVRRAYGSGFGDDEIEDIYSSAWLGTLRALERRHAELDDDEIRSYLLTAVANQASKELRRRRRKPIAPLEAAGSVADAADTPEDRATAGETSRIARDVLSSLPPRRRAVMLLRYGWGLDPSEVCGMVEGLSPRAYRKEITRGVDELTKRIKLVEEGRWCAEREALLKAYASGLADDDETRQAQHHLAHCRPCHEFVGKLTGHLHDIGSAIALPVALEAVDANATLLERLGGAAERARDAMPGLASRSEVTEAAASLPAARGGGVLGAGALAKLAGLGGAGKVALGCLGAGAITTACVVGGIVPGIGPGGDRPDADEVVARSDSGPSRVEDPIRRATPKPKANRAPRETRREHARREPRPASDSVSPAVEPSAPPVEQEFGVASAAPAPAPAAAPGGAASSQDVQKEFGP